MNREHDLKLLKAAGYEVDNAINELGGIEMYDEIINDFYTENLERVQRIIKDKESGDIKNYTIEVHAMKSECMYLGMMYLANMCFEHQLKGEANDTEYINSHFDELMMEIAKVLTVVKQYLGK